MNREHEEPRRRSAVVIVAHPDDETIWCGGLILQHPDWEWTIITLCRASDRDRQPKFARVCKHLGANGVIFDLDDSSPLKPVSPPDDIGRPILGIAGGRPWDLCITHGTNGEYGHLRHRQVHAEVLRLAREGLLCCAELWTFAYDCRVETAECAAGGDADIRISLAPRQLAEKKRIIRELYGFGSESFEFRACVSPEAFVLRPVARARGAPQ